MYEASGRNMSPVLLYMDAIGIRGAIFSLAEKLAESGFFVLMPNLFYRNHPLPLTDYPEVFTKDQLGSFFPEIKNYMNYLTPELLLEDARFYLDQLQGNTLVESKKGVKIIGFCFGGGHGIRTAATYPEEISHVSSLHGGQLAVDDDHSPIKYLSHLKAKLFFGHADHDSSMPRPMIEKLEQELGRNQHLEFTSKIFTHAHHGFTMMDLPAYVREASEESIQQTIDFFNT